MSMMKWKEEAENISLFRGPGIGGFDTVKPMLEISPTNRVVSVEFARLATAIRMLGVHLGDNYKWLGEIVDMAEAYQLTIGDSKNSREAFIEALKARYGYIRPEAREGVKRGVTGL